MKGRRRIKNCLKYANEKLSYKAKQKQTLDFFILFSCRKWNLFDIFSLYDFNKRYHQRMFSFLFSLVPYFFNIHENLKYFNTNIFVLRLVFLGVFCSKPFLLFIVGTHDLNTLCIILKLFFETSLNFQLKL